MAKQTINIGTAPNSRNGDPIRTAFDKVNQNFTELYNGAFSGSYNDLTNKPTLFSGSYDDLINKPQLFSGSYNDLTETPSLDYLPLNSASGQDVFSEGTISFYKLSPSAVWGPNLNWVGATSFSDAGLSSVIWNSIDINSGAVLITLDWNNPTKKQWIFSSSGGLVFPDNTVQTTAYTGGGGASYNQSLNTTDNVQFVDVTSTGTVWASRIEHPNVGDIVIKPWSWYNQGSAADNYNYAFGAPNQFGTSVFQVPSEVVIKPNGADSNESVTLQSNNATELKCDTQFPPTTSSVLVEGTQVSIIVDTAGQTGTRRDWEFTTQGFRFPDSTIQTTAFNGTERIQTKNASTGVVEHNCSTGTVFYHTSASSNFTANITQLVTMVNGVGRAGSVTLVIAQGATPYICNAVQINGVAQTILWQGSTSAPTGNANKTDIITFSIMQTGISTYIIFGQLVSFG